MRRKIFAGKFSREKALPSEDTLAAEYEVSRITVRQALSSLEQEGLVTRQRGRGTFVSGKVVPISPPQADRFHRGFDLNGGPDPHGGYRYQLDRAA